MARFYALKKLKKSRGIIDNNDTFLQESSRWAGIQLNTITKDLESRLADSFEMLEIMQGYIKTNGPLPHYARLIDANANTMYPCLQTEDCIEALQLWTATYPNRAKGIPLNFLWKVLKAVMDENVFKFGEH